MTMNDSSFFHTCQAPKKRLENGHVILFETQTVSTKEGRNKEKTCPICFKDMSSSEPKNFARHVYGSYGQDPRQECRRRVAQFNVSNVLQIRALKKEKEILALIQWEPSHIPVDMLPFEMIQSYLNSKDDPYSQKAYEDSKIVEHDDLDHGSEDYGYEDLEGYEKNGNDINNLEVLTAFQALKQIIEKTENNELITWFNEVSTCGVVPGLPDELELMTGTYCSTRSDRWKYQCPKCDLTFKYKAECSRHILKAKNKIKCSENGFKLEKIRVRAILGLRTRYAVAKDVDFKDSKKKKSMIVGKIVHEALVDWTESYHNISDLLSPLHIIKFMKRINQTIPKSPLPPMKLPLEKLKSLLESDPGLPLQASLNSKKDDHIYEIIYIDDKAEIHEIFNAKLQTLSEIELSKGIIYLPVYKNQKELKDQSGKLVTRSAVAVKKFLELVSELQVQQKMKIPAKMKIINFPKPASEPSRSSQRLKCKIPHPRERLSQSPISTGIIDGKSMNEHKKHLCSLFAF